MQTLLGVSAGPGTSRPSPCGRSSMQPRGAARCQRTARSVAMRASTLNRSSVDQIYAAGSLASVAEQADIDLKQLRDVKVNGGPACPACVWPCMRVAGAHRPCRSAVATACCMAPAAAPHVCSTDPTRPVPLPACRGGGVQEDTRTPPPASQPLNLPHPFSSPAPTVPSPAQAMPHGVSWVDPTSPRPTCLPAPAPCPLLLPPALATTALSDQLPQTMTGRRASRTCRAAAWTMKDSTLTASMRRACHWCTTRPRSEP
jgi:hypothetical protein